MHAAAFSPRGGGVSPRGTLLQGQSIIEYVLIAAVIGLVVVFAGPQVSGAIRNQFNLVGNTVNGMADDGTEALTDILFGEAVVSLGHISPFVPGPKDSDLRELWETSLCRIRPMG